MRDDILASLNSAPAATFLETVKKLKETVITWTYYTSIRTYILLVTTSVSRYVTEKDSISLRNATHMAYPLLADRANRIAATFHGGVLGLLPCSLSPLAPLSPCSDMSPSLPSSTTVEHSRFSSSRKRVPYPLSTSRRAGIIAKTPPTFLAPPYSIAGISSQNIFHSSVLTATTRHGRLSPVRNDQTFISKAMKPTA